MPPSEESGAALSTSITPAASRPQSSQGSRSGTSTPRPSSAMDVSKSPEDSGKLRTFVGILKKFIGVNDMAAQRFSLPAQLMEPIPNLEYWQYLDRPEAFASIPDSVDPLGRMLSVLRFWFTKDLKYVKGKPCKPYNSVLGEFFRCNWEVESSLPALSGPANAATVSNTPATVSFLCEQTSHHPPVSAYWYECPSKGISARGFDQLSAKFTGTSVRVQPGVYNKGIYLDLHAPAPEESYHLTHPVAYLGGFLRGSLSVSVADHVYVSCPKTKLKAILQYVEESWIGRAQYKVIGVIFKYNPDKDDTTKIKDVPDADVLARIDGNWHEDIYYTPGPKSFDKNADKTLIIDLRPLMPEPKTVPAEDIQLPNESRRYWTAVTEGIMTKQYTAATNAKIEIEERQRQKAKDREARGVHWKPRFFQDPLGPDGKPDLTAEGRELVDRVNRGDWTLTESAETAA